ncbi:nucleotidyltransferase [Enterococcus sp. AZ103]|uniref:nucleotidyltransferase n=1 Tax=Enterococcus sp. AZ103 TaxID=2774628 RepID=UPI003F2462C0
MKSCGIIVEYNPFHYGHAYHAKMARKLSGAEIIIAVMSGNFLQRGEPAILDKWDRAEVALRNGVDLVVELPFSWAVQSADYFARGSVKMLQSLQCEALCFGTDEENDFDYQSYGDFFNQHQVEIDNYFKSLPINLSYPEKMAQTVRHFLPKLAEFPPNHILALSYAKENAKYAKPMTLFPLKRQGQGYHDNQLMVQSFASATGIRQAVNLGNDFSNFVPELTEKKLFDYHLSWSDFWPYLYYQLKVSTPKELKMLYQMNEGVEFRLLNQLRPDFSDYLAGIQTKRYTKARLQRLLVYTLLQVKPAEIAYEQENSLLHILGFTDAGKKYLNQHKKDFTLPMAAKIGKQEQANHLLTYRSDQIYQMLHPVEQNLGRFPLQV